MHFKLYRILTEKLKPQRGEFRAAEPELLKDWRAEVEFERRRWRNIATLNRIAEREARERTAQLPWWWRALAKGRRRR
jgi:hypothetical protein